MKIKADIGSVVGETSHEHWAQVLTLPGAYAVLEIVDEDKIARTKGLKLLSDLTRRLEPLPVSLSEVEKIVQDLCSENVVSLVLAVPVGTVLYIAVCGKGEVFLKRSDRVSKLLDGDGSTSGTISKHDIFAFVSGEIASVLGEEAIINSFDHLNAQESAEKMTLMLHQQQKSVSGAALIYQVSDLVLEEEIAEEEAEEKDSFQTKFIRLKQYVKPKLSRAVRLTLRGKAPQAIRLYRRVRSRRRSTQMAAFFAVGFLVILFVVSVVLGVRKQLTSKVDKDAESAIVLAQGFYDEGVALVELNPIKSRQKLTEALNVLKPLKQKIHPRSPTGHKLDSLYISIEDNLTLASKIYKTEPELFFDISLLKNDARAHNLSLFENLMGILDRNTKTVYTLDVSNKKAEMIGKIESINQSSYVSVYGDKLYINTSQGIYVLSQEGGNIDKPIIEANDNWGSITAMSSFAGNLYLLDSQKSRIWKYVVAETGFTDMKEYLNPDVFPDFSISDSLAIDGSIWVSGKNGKILRFTQGVEDTFTTEGIDPPLGQNLSIFTSDEDEKLYVLDKENKRVVIINKEGLYESQYTWEKDLVASDLLVSSANNKVLLLVGGMIYAFDLN